MSTLHIDLSEYDAMRRENEDNRKRIKELEAERDSLKSGARCIINTKTVMDPFDMEMFIKDVQIYCEKMVRNGDFFSESATSLHNNIMYMYDVARNKFNATEPRIVSQSSQYANFDDIENSIKAKIEAQYRDSWEQEIEKTKLKGEEYEEAKKKVEEDISAKYKAMKDIDIKKAVEEALEKANEESRKAIKEALEEKDKEAQKAEKRYTNEISMLRDELIAAKKKITSLVNISKSIIINMADFISNMKFSMFMKRKKVRVNDFASHVIPKNKIYSDEVEDIMFNVSKELDGVD